MCWGVWGGVWERVLQEEVRLTSLTFKGISVKRKTEFRTHFFPLFFRGAARGIVSIFSSNLIQKYFPCASESTSEEHRKHRNIGIPHGSMHRNAPRKGVLAEKWGVAKGYLM